MARYQLILMDPPRHTELRYLMNTQFKPRAIRDTVAHMRELRVLADRFRDGEEIEAIIRYGLATAADRCDQGVSSR